MTGKLGKQFVHFRTLFRCEPFEAEICINARGEARDVLGLAPSWSLAQGSGADRIIPEPQHPRVKSRERDRAAGHVKRGDLVQRDRDHRGAGEREGVGLGERRLALIDAVQKERATCEGSIVERGRSPFDGVRQCPQPATITAQPKAERRHACIAVPLLVDRGRPDGDQESHPPRARSDSARYGQRPRARFSPGRKNELYWPANEERHAADQVRRCGSIIPNIGSTPGLVVRDRLNGGEVHRGTR